MTWNLNSERPIYAQIIEKVQMDIISGRYKSGDKLPSVRELAAEASVNPNTMQKALAELESSGLVYSQRTAGRFITEDNAMIKKLQHDIAKQELQNFIEKMRQLGFSQEDIIHLIKQVDEEEKS